MTQRLLLANTDAVARVAALLPAVMVAYANGQLPEGIAGEADVIAFGPEGWAQDIAAQAKAAGCARVRFGVGDITQIDTEAPAAWLKQRFTEYTTSAPQVNPPASDGSPPATGAEPRGADPAQRASAGVTTLEGRQGDHPVQSEAHPNTPESPTVDFQHPAWQDIPIEAEETHQRTIRTASALKRAAFERTDAEQGDWPDPADFWGATELPEFLPEYLPPAIEPYVTDQASRAGLDPAQVALNCYVICAALLRSGIELQMQEGSDDGRVWKEKPVLWGAVVGDPSSGKGPALDIALHKFYKIASALRAKDEAAWERYDEESKIHERRMQSYLAEAAKSPLAVKPEAPTKPPRERLWTDDVTKEVVAKLLTENPRSKIAIIKDELASWFGGFDAYGNGKSDKDRPDWLSFYESKERYIDRAMEGRSYHVASWGGILLGGIQPEVLQKISGKLGADGMLQRFQIIIAKPKRQVPKRPADADAVKQWNKVQENLAAMQAPMRPITLSAEASAFMDEQAQWIATAQQAGLSPALQAALGKWEGLFGRLMITSHCIECAALGMTVPSPVVSLKTAEQVWRWMRGLLFPHAVHFYSGMADQGDDAGSVRIFAEYVLARGIESVRPHWLASNWTHYRRNFKTIQYRREFWARVEQAGWARPIGIFDRANSISTEYEINPAVFDGRFAEQIKAAQERAEYYRATLLPKFQARVPGED